MKGYLAIVIGLLLSGVVSAGAFTVKLAAATTKAPTTTPTTTPKRVMTLEEAVELGVVSAPTKQPVKNNHTNPWVYN